MKIVFSLLLCSVVFLLQAQDMTFEKPNYKQIKRNIANEKSNLFYDILMQKYKNSDSTLNLNEKRHLYYGYTFQDTYSAYAISDYEDSLNVHFKNESHNPFVLQEIIRVSDSILKEKPFSLQTLNAQLYAFDKLGDQENFNKKITQAKIIFDALLSSGNGHSKQDAFYVIYTSHEYILLNYLGYQFGGQQSLIEHYDFLTIKNPTEELEGLYFDVSPCLNSLNSLFKN
ncbi:DUF4919 domain-containing protein [Aestuariibaculum sediminum]|uniref:DUF4919 domain-containing protein n=1 Tax=Aestuariibaculum sediminum TaxID=2770637 RepID=A0A8J6U7Z3_9FLAO|nr:DUF4919 domain-containing protein [Aestuariibaculum sediminum]MBD0830612.1 DUF4919 domain-containing protein [Aestuariibaculum sediminum]